MPCRDAMDDLCRNEDYAERVMLRAAMCAILTLLEKDPAGFVLMLKKIDWKEAGVSKREFMRWWEDHKEKDAARQVREAKEKAEKKIRDEALSKLTDEEKKILGVK